jgi:AcrR family transcriptional regulator
MPDAVPQQLPRGRHRLSREEVEQSQRSRLQLALAVAMSEKGYVGTSVADILKRAGVGRETFYQHFTSKLDCFMHAFDLACDVLLARLDMLEHSPGSTPAERFEVFFAAYLDVLADQPALSRVFLVEVYAAGPEAVERRSAIQADITTRLTRLLDVDTAEGRFACEMLVAAVANLVTRPLVTGDVDALRALRDPVVAVVRAALEPVRRS